MGFLDSNSTSSFVEVTDKKHKIRPLISKPIKKWLHKFPTPESVVEIDGKPEVLRLRDYHEEICTSTDQRGSGCAVHGRQDPAWHLLTGRDQTNKKGQRVDFPASPKYLTLCWDYDAEGGAGDVKWLKGGSQIYAEMNKWDDTGRSITECDWFVWKTGKGKTTEYASSREDCTTFNGVVTDERKAQALEELKKEFTSLAAGELERAMVACSPAQAKAKFLEGRRGLSAPALSAAPAQPQLPAAQLSPLESLRLAFPQLAEDQLKSMVALATQNPQ